MFEPAPEPFFDDVVIGFTPPSEENIDDDFQGEDEQPKETTLNDCS